MVYLLLWCSGAGQALADNVLLLRGVETLSIRDINPIPVLQVLSRNVKHSVSSMGISLGTQPDWVRCVSMGLAALHSLTQRDPSGLLICTVCVCAVLILSCSKKSEGHCCSVWL